MRVAWRLKEDGQELATVVWEDGDLTVEPARGREADADDLLDALRTLPVYDPSTGRIADTADSVHAVVQRLGGLAGYGVEVEVVEGSDELPVIEEDREPGVLY